MLERVEFYAEDLAILRELGHEVVIATRWHELRPADAYFVWWWTWAFIPLALGLLLSRPVVITGTFDEWAFDGRPWPHRLLLRAALRWSSANLFVSQLETRVVPGRFTVATPRYAPHSVDLEFYRPGDAVRLPFLLTVGWLAAGNAERKGIPVCIQAMALLREEFPELRLVIAGAPGTASPSLQLLVQSLGLEGRVEFAGAVSRDRKRELLQQCAAYLQPSKFEGFGVAALEAMACGAPVVGSRGGALPEVLGDAALMADPPTAANVAQQVRRLLHATDDADVLGRRARERAASLFSRQRRRDEIAAVLSGRRGPRVP